MHQLEEELKGVINNYMGIKSKLVVLEEEKLKEQVKNEACYKQLSAKEDIIGKLQQDINLLSE